jgi:hypothetical protein
MLVLPLASADERLHTETAAEREAFVVHGRRAPTAVLDRDPAGHEREDSGNAFERLAS